jgi:hypothetical protein
VTEDTKTTGVSATNLRTDANVETSFFEGLKNQSGKIEKLATALAKAQSEIVGARKTSKNPYFKSDYADLFEVLEATRPILSKHGLSIIQTNNGVEIIGNTAFLHVGTMLMHTSGQWIRSFIPLPIESPVNCHKLGSAMTYGRRYGLSAMVGIAQMDDDGNAATTGTTNPEDVAPHRRSTRTVTGNSGTKVEPLVQSVDPRTLTDNPIPIDGGTV